MGQTVTHRGTVENVTGKHISVRIIQDSACSACSAKRMCNAAESKEKVVCVVSPEASSYRPGDAVLLTGSTEMGLAAVWWAYVLPLLLLLSALFFSVWLTGAEPLAALLAIGVLAAYYAVLYANRQRLTNRFSFTVKHLK